MSDATASIDPMEKRWIVYGSELSPFTLKTIAACSFSGLPHRFYPEEGGLVENLRIQMRLRRLRAGKLPLTWPKKDDRDEFPLVPYLFGPQGENLYDSSAIAVWLDETSPVQRDSGRLYPASDPGLDYVAWLIEEYADEFGLYMAHHFRWKFSATDNDAGDRLAREFRSLAGLAQPLFSRWFAARQVRRLPYLFSVAPEGFRIDALPKRLQPPARAGFPPTHDFLEESYARLLDALEGLLRSQPYLLGQRFLAADAAVYGQIAINLDDRSARRWVADRAPTVFAWVEKIRNGDFSDSKPDGPLALHEGLASLLAEIVRVYPPLMKQNHQAYQKHRRSGEALFNEAAFNRDEALYDGEVDGVPFRSVVKTFQVKSWVGLCDRWAALDRDSKRRVESFLPPEHGLDDPL